MSVGFERAYEQFDMFERSRKVLDEIEKYDFEHERVIIFITDGRVQASEKQVKYEDTMKVSLSGLHGQERPWFDWIQVKPKVTGLLSK